MSRNRKLLLLGCAIAAAAVVVAVAVALGSGGSSKSTAPTTTSTTTTASFLAGVTQRGDTLGKATAPATLLVFEDPQCPYCREWSLGALPTVVDQFVKTGRVKLVWRGIDIIGPNSDVGLRAAYAAAEQNRLWNLVDQLYQLQGDENSGWITDSLLRQAAEGAGVNATKMLAAMPTAAVTAKLKKSAADEMDFSVNGTPTFILERPPGLPQQLQVASLDPTTFSATLSSALQ